MSEQEVKQEIDIDFSFELLGAAERLWDQLEDERSDLWREIGDVVEKLVPGIGPFDRREAVDQILQPMRAWLDVA